MKSPDFSLISMTNLAKLLDIITAIQYLCVQPMTTKRALILKEYKL